MGAFFGPMIGSMIAGYFANRTNAQQMQYATDMSGTAYRRARYDMEQAGLNPAMMYAGSGGAASTPNVSLQNPAASLPSAVQAAQQLKLDTRMTNAKVDTEISQQDANRAVMRNQTSSARLNEFDRVLKDKTWDQQLEMVGADLATRKANALYTASAARLNDVNARRGLAELTGQEFESERLKRFKELFPEGSSFPYFLSGAGAFLGDTAKAFGNVFKPLAIP